MTNLVATDIAEVKVITRPACQPCKMTLRRFGDYDLTIIDSAVDSNTALDLANQLGYSAAPIVVVYDGDGNITDHWTGFVPDKIDSVVNAS